ncbi:unnamed protein product, partial [Hapterophycus canaliculatus]
SLRHAFATRVGTLFARSMFPFQFKRWRAPVKRDLVVWMYDVSKQGFGAMFIHVWNILLSI